MLRFLFLGPLNFGGPKQGLVGPVLCLRPMKVSGGYVLGSTMTKPANWARAMGSPILELGVSLVGLKSDREVTARLWIGCLARVLRGDATTGWSLAADARLHRLLVAIRISAS